MSEFFYVSAFPTVSLLTFVPGHQLFPFTPVPLLHFIIFHWLKRDQTFVLLFWCFTRHWPSKFLSQQSPDCRPWASSHSCIPRSPGLWDCADVSKSVQPKGAGLKMTGAGMQLVVKIHPVHILGDFALGSFQAGPMGSKQREPFSSSERGPVCVSCSLLETKPQGFAVLQGQYELEC